MDIWQTTNQEPWVTAFVEGAIKFKTRTSPIYAPVGSPILLHCSTKLWPAWREFDNKVMLRYVERLPELRRNLGHVIAVATLSHIGTFSDYSNEDLLPWKVTWGNCAAFYTWECSDILILKTPVKARGFQAPFCRAKPDTVKRVLSANPKAARILRPKS